MEGLARLQASRRGYRAHVTKTFGRITEITDSTGPIIPAQMISLRTALEQLQQKKIKLEEVDTRIADSIQDAKALEEEICEVKEYRTVLMEKIAFLQDFISPSRLLSPTSETSDTETLNHSNAVMNSDTHHEEAVTSSGVKQPQELETEGVTDTEHVSENTHHSSDGAHHSISRLPKLSLPYFSGDPLMWQTFWDSFSAAVHINPNLTGIQKFNYLRAQLKGDATRVVAAGFPLTDVNYQQSITLLRERFGQPYKLINAHMQTLLNLSNATNSLSSLQSFYDTETS